MESLKCPFHSHILLLFLTPSEMSDTCLARAVQDPGHQGPEEGTCWTTPAISMLENQHFARVTKTMACLFQAVSVWPWCRQSLSATTELWAWRGSILLCPEWSKIPSYGSSPSLCSLTRDSCGHVTPVLQRCMFNEMLLLVYMMGLNKPVAPQPLSTLCSALSHSTGTSFQAAHSQAQ